MLRFGALRATRKGPEHFSERLREIHAMLAALIEEFQPHSVAVESVFTALNMKTALRLAEVRGVVDRKSTRLNSSHQIISYAVFCLKKKKQIPQKPYAHQPRRNHPYTTLCSHH